VFTTRGLPLASSDDWHRVAGAVGAERVATLDQVHGRDVVVLGGPVPPDRRPRGDAWVSSDPSTAVAVRAADCVPLLLADTATGAVAAVHAGWRGTAAGVAAAVVAALARQFGSQPEHLAAAIGPSIGACCYRVGPDVVEAFAAAGQGALERWFIGRDSGSGTGDPHEVRLDLVAATRDQLLAAGVPEAQIHACGLCTAMHLDVLTSYRAEKEKAGRLAAAIRARAYNRA